MSLEEYRRKRVFSKTPEPSPQNAQERRVPGAPPPAKAAEREGNRFFIQRHSARRLHYDLRLEWDGVLKSWALPHGPTLDPAIKRLAVHVEDHPLDYGNFEGTIPSGNYGAGSVVLWDRGTYEWLGDRPPEEQWKKGDLKFQLHGQKLAGEFALVRTNRNKGKDWLLIKKKDFAVREGWDPEADTRSVLGPAELGSIEGAVKAEMPASLTPMLAVLGTGIPSGTDWLYEVKWDGYRALCFIADGKVRMVSRRGNNLNKQFAPIAEALLPAVKAETAIIDGEVVALDEQGKPSFQHLQNLTGFGTKPALKGAAPPPLNFFAFDLLYLNGYDLRKAALIDRRQLLSSILLPSESIRYSDHFAGKGEELLEAVRAQGLEGVIAKQAQSRYEQKRSNCWIKIKVTMQQDFVICGFIEGERDYFGALVLGYYKDGKLVYAGNVGSGFTQQSLKSVFEQIKRLITKKAVLSDVPREIGEVTWCKPELVCMVKFNSWTGDGRLRAPVFMGMRNEVEPQEVVRETGLVEHAPAARKELLPPDKAEVALTIDGRQLKFTNLKKVFYPADGYTKRDLINFYDGVADLLVPHLQGRPLSLKRYPNGIDQDYFFQKDASGFPEWLHREELKDEEDAESKIRVICDDRASLLYLANLGCIDQNPYMSRLGSLEHPDFILIDLDPYHCGYDRIVEAARLVHEKLRGIGLEGYPKTTGGNGMHIYVPVEPIYQFSQTRAFAEVLCRWVAGERPDLFTMPRTVSAREKGKVYFDYLQNASGKTISAPYVLRAHPGAPVATPLKWEEVVPGLKPAQFHIANVLRRFERAGDLFAGVLKKPQELGPALEKMGKAMG
ncbi:MAG TPA: DNA ligase D [Candidatus Angelobacter sp.]|nr:DNA ligase D [Candidatus Angelobacter sp.]